MEDLVGVVQRQRAHFLQSITKSVEFRLQNLQKLYDAVSQFEPDLVAALHQDLHKSEFEAYSTEIGVLRADLRHVIKHMRKWAKPKKVHTPLTHIGSKSYLHPEPYGVVLVIAPWNYPILLSISPLVGAIAAGNCAVLKPSELAPNTSRVMAQMIKSVFPEEYVTVVEGGVETSTALLEQPFDYIFFTGGTSVGRIVAEAAAKNLTPVTLELGGKSPCMVHEDANLKLAAKRIVWGKFTNAGQTCIAPDYLLVHRGIKESFVQQLKDEITNVYGLDPLGHKDYVHIINERHFNRIVEYLGQGSTLHGGRHDKERLAVEPTIVDNVRFDDPVMQDEIFGPILPVVEYDSLPEAIDFIRRYPKPLALYVFSQSPSVEQTVLHDISFGGGCVNDTLYHIATPHLPFGGVGHSGMGAYHGKYSFDTFTHYKPVLRQTTKFDIPVRYPNSKNALKRIKWFLK